MSVVDNYLKQPARFNVRDSVIYETPEVNKEKYGEDIFVKITDIKSVEEMLSENKLSVDEYGGIDKLKSDYPDGHVYYGELYKPLHFVKYNKFLKTNTYNKLDVVNDISSSELKKDNQHPLSGGGRRRRKTKRAAKSHRRRARRVRKTRR